MRHPRPQKGNPHKLVINQHIFPRKSISRFTNKHGMVEVFHNGLQKTLNLKPNNNLFCANRAWDQRSELGYMKGIEDAFQSLVSRIVEREEFTLREEENRVALSFLALWELRHSHHINPIGDVELVGIHPGDVLAKDEEEVLEKKGYIVGNSKRSKAMIESRFMAGTNIQVSIDQKCVAHQDMKWGVVRSIEGEFIVPDTFSSFAIIPISPCIVLAGNSKNIFITQNEVGKVNRLAISSSKNYFFAKNLSHCPT